MTKKAHSLHLRSERGVALIHVIVVGAIMGAMAAGSLRILDNRTKLLRITRLASQMAALEKRVQNVAKSENAMVYSGLRASSGLLYSCFRWSQCQAKGFLPVVIYNSLGDPITGYFNVKGEPCTTRRLSHCH